MSRELLPREEYAGTSSTRNSGREASAFYRSQSGKFVRHSGQEFPTYEEAWNSRLDTNPQLLSRMPWVLPVSVDDEGLVRRYLSGDIFPCGTPIEAIWSYDWRNRIAIPNRDLNIQMFESSVAAREGIARQVIARHRRHFTPLRPISPSYGVDAYAYRSLDEIKYVDNLMDLNVSAWQGSTKVDSNLLCWEEPILPMEFRYISKSRTFWEWTFWERRMRARTGLLIPYQCIEAEVILAEMRYRRWPSVPEAFKSVEMSPGCRAELPPIVTYKGSEMSRDPNSGYWAQFFSEWPARVAVWVLWDLYESHRLWYIPPRLRADMYDLNLNFVLGSKANAAELHRLVTTIESIEWRQAVFRHTKTTDVAYDDSNKSAPGDFVFYDPWRRERLDSHEEAQNRLRQKPNMPADHPRGYIYLDRESSLAARDQYGGSSSIAGGVAARSVPVVVTSVRSSASSNGTSDRDWQLWPHSPVFSGD